MKNLFVFLVAIFVFTSLSAEDSLCKTPSLIEKGKSSKTISYNNGFEKVFVTFPKKPIKLKDDDFVEYQYDISNKIWYLMFTPRSASSDIDVKNIISSYVNEMKDKKIKISYVDHNVDASIPYSDIEGTKKINGKKHYVKVRIYVTENSYYYLAVEYHKDKSHKVDFQSFVDSFYIEKV